MDRGESPRVMGPKGFGLSVIGALAKNSPWPIFYTWLLYQQLWLSLLRDFKLMLEARSLIGRKTGLDFIRWERYLVSINLKTHLMWPSWPIIFYWISKLHLVLCKVYIHVLLAGVHRRLGPKLYNFLFIMVRELACLGPRIPILRNILTQVNLHCYLFYAWFPLWLPCYLSPSYTVGYTSSDAPSDGQNLYLTLSPF